MRACPRPRPKGACARCFSGLLTSGFGRRPNFRRGATDVIAPGGVGDTMRSAAVERNAKRNVTKLLALGILIAPAFFVWFLLRHRHNALARVIGFSWAAFLTLAWFAILSGPSASGVAVTESVSEGTASPNPSPSAESAPLLKIERRPELSPAARELKSLYAKLEDFRHNPEFLRVGFGRCCQYRDWKQRAERLASEHGSALLNELGIGPNDLVQLGLEYSQNSGRSTRLSDEIVSRLNYALAPAMPAEGGGRITMVGWWCRDLEQWFASLQASENQEYAKATIMRVEPACPRVLPNMTTGPILERRHYRSQSGAIGAEFVKVKLANGPEIWAPTDAIEFR